MEREQIEFALLAEGFGGPAMSLRGDFEVVQRGTDVNRLAAIAAMIFA